MMLASVKGDLVMRYRLTKGGDFVYAKVEHIVDGLIEGKSYTFRVVAENPSGFGPRGEKTCEILIDADFIGPIEVRSGEGHPRGRNMSFSALSDAPFAKQALEREMVYRKEELFANLLNKRV